MAKIEGSVGRGDLHFFRPETLVIVTEPTDPLYDERVNLPLDENMIRNVMVHGVIEPVIIHRDGTAYKVVAGRQRVRWAMEANKRLEKEGKEALAVPCKLDRSTDDAALGILISENECRIEDDHLIKAAKLARYLATGKTEEDAASVFAKPVSWVQSMLRLQECSATVRRAVQTGQISVSSAGKLAALSREDQDRELGDLVAGGGKASFAKVYDRVQAKTGGKRSAAPSKKEVKKFYKENLNELGAEGCAILEWVISGEQTGVVLELARAEAASRAPLEIRCTLDDGTDDDAGDPSAFTDDDTSEPLGETD